MTGVELHDVRVTVNGVTSAARTEARTSLADFLRDGCGLTGTHLGCEHGICGACTVIVDGDAVRSCLVFAVQADGADVETVESLAPGGALDPLQQAFTDEHGLQCGFCTPGLLMALTAARRDSVPLDEALGEVLGGHLCRCTGYAGIRSAIARVWQAGAPG